MGGSISRVGNDDHADGVILPSDQQSQSQRQSHQTSLDDIPESCISSLLMSFDPQEICKLARVNKAFHRASSADFVWESKLPQSYKFLLNKVLLVGEEEKLGSLTKKEIYAKLCRPNFFDGGTKVSN